MKKILLGLILIISSQAFGGDCSVNPQFQSELFSTKEAQKISRYLNKMFAKKGYNVLQSDEANFHLEIDYSYATSENWCNIYMAQAQVVNRDRAEVAYGFGEASIYTEILRPSKMGISATMKSLKKLFKELPACK